MNYTIYVADEAEVMTKFLGIAVVIAEDWYAKNDVRIVDNATGEVIREYGVEGD